MKYRVKFKCYWFNTGAADNHYYINHEDFDTLEEAKLFEQRVKKQVQIGRDWTSGKISASEIIKFNDSSEHIEVENGFIVNDETSIVKYFPESEQEL